MAGEFARASQARFSVGIVLGIRFGLFWRALHRAGGAATDTFGIAMLTLVRRIVRGPFDLTYGLV